MGLILIRHAQALHNVQKHRVAGKKLLSPLTAEGIHQAMQKGQQLALSGKDVKTIYHSGALRAQQTAAYIAEAFDKTPELLEDPKLHEMDAGEVVGKLKLSIILNPALVYKLLTRKLDFKFSGGESFNDAATRMDISCSSIASKHDVDNVLVVTHGLAIRSLLARKNNWSVFKILRTEIKNTQSVELEY